MAEYSDQTLEETPERVTKFLCGIASMPMIRTIMATSGGMEDADIKEGQDALIAVLTAPPLELPTQDTPESKAVREALVELDGWDEKNFAIAKAALDRKFPDQSAYVFKDLSAKRGVASVEAISTFLGRVKAMEEGTDAARASTREADRQAVALLAKRKITPEVRSELENKIKLVTGPTPVLSDAALGGDPVARRAQLVALKQWYDEWAAIAHRVIVKRKHLIKLGLASRRSRSVEVEEPTEEPAGTTPGTDPTAPAATGTPAKPDKPGTAVPVR